MKEELIFHLVRKPNWKSAQEKGLYEPEEYVEEGYIPCATGKNIESVANNKFEGIDDLLLLVIDPSRVNTKVAFDNEEGSEDSPRIEGPLNKDAVIDKIELIANEDDKFEISVEGD